MSTIAFKKFYTNSEQYHSAIKYLYHLQVREDEQNISDYFIPDGCLELVIDLAERVHVRPKDGLWQMRPRISIMGHQSTCVEVACEGSHYHSIGARISMQYISALIPVMSLREENYPIDIDSIFPNNSDRLMKWLDSAPSTSEKIKVLDRFIGEKLKGSPRHPAFLDHSLQLMIQNHGQISVGDVSKKVRCSTRHLRRSFLKYFGVSPKVFSSIIRLHYTVCHIAQQQRPMSDVISDHGYFDRAHFYKEFTRIVGISPSAYLNGNRVLSRYFLSRAVVPLEQLVGSY